MRLLSFKMFDEIRLGLFLRGRVVDLNGAYNLLFGSKPFTSDMTSFLKNEDNMSKARDVEKASLVKWNKLQSNKNIVNYVKDVDILAPIPKPRKNIVCLGLNYVDHAKELKSPKPEFPIFFTKPSTSVIGPNNYILLPKFSRKVDYEVELAFVFGKRGKNISEEEAYEYIVGYTVFNDVTARDLQKKHKQWYKGKGLDTFAPMGPYLVTKDEVPDPHNLTLSMKLNNTIMQKSNTRHMIFKIPTLVKHISADMTVEPGDIVATGTPPGVGFVRKPPVFLKEGDFLSAEIEKIGILNNGVTSY